jgi:phage-related protein
MNLWGLSYHEPAMAVRFADVVYVLHAFQKKSKQGIKTPQTDVKLIAERLKRAQADYESRGKP